MNEQQFTSYDLSRDWFDFCFENPDIISPNHTALYFFIIEHCNRMGWKSKFGLPMEMAKEAIGIKNYKTYSKAFNDLIDFGFVKIFERSKNQYSANIIGLVKNTKATSKALTKARQKHNQKQVHGIVGIIKPNNKEQLNMLGDHTQNLKDFYVTDLIIQNILNQNQLIGHWAGIAKIDNNSAKKHLNEFLIDKKIIEKKYENIADLKSHISNWFKTNNFNKQLEKPVQADKKKIDHIQYTLREGEKSL